MKYARTAFVAEVYLLIKNKRILDLFTLSSRSPISSRRAFSELYGRAHLPIFRYIYGLVGGNQVEAEDLASETFFRAWRARKGFTGDKKDALKWLFTIARRQVIDDQRRKSVCPIVDVDLDGELPGVRIPPENEMVQKEEQEEIWVRLRTIPMPAREMLVLRYMEDWKVNQIAAHLDIPENTVSVTMQRALKKLATARLPEDEEE